MKLLVAPATGGLPINSDAVIQLPEHEHDAGILFHRTGRPVVAVALTAGPAGREAGCRFCGRVGSIVYERFGAERLAR